MNDTTNTSYDYLSAPVVVDGELNLQGVMNVALSFFDRTRHIENDSAEKEVILFKQILPMSIVSCASMSDWSFLVKTIEYEPDDIINDNPVPYDKFIDRAGVCRGDAFFIGDNKYVHVYMTYKNFIYGYKLPRHFLKTKYIEGDHRIGFAIKGDSIYCNLKGCTMDYIADMSDELPTDYGYLVAYRCAMDMAQHLDPEGTALARASAMFQSAYTMLKQRDDASFRLQNPPQNHYIDIDDTYWGYKR